MVNSIIILAVIVLPGWVSISAAQLYHPRVVNRAALMVWGMMFYHAAIVHVIGVGTVAAAALICRGFFLDTLDLDRVLTDGAVEFMQDSPGRAFAVFGAYFLWMVAGSVLFGVADVPSKLTFVIGKVAQKARLASEPVEEEPVWYSALNIGRKRLNKTNVQVLVQMKNGAVYVGNLVSYPILPDSVESKDIRLGKSEWYPDGDLSSEPTALDFANDEGGVLLNTANVDSIHYLLVEDYDNAGEEGAGEG